MGKQCTVCLRLKCKSSVFKLHDLYKGTENTCVTSVRQRQDRQGKSTAHESYYVITYPKSRVASVTV